MGTLKDSATGYETYTLTEPEWTLIKQLNIVLQFVTLKDNLITQLINVICYNRFNYSPDDRLILAMDLGSDDRILRVKKEATPAVKKLAKDMNRRKKK